MARIKNHLTAVTFLFLFISWTGGQSDPRRPARSRTVQGADQTCVLNGTYRVDAANSDQLYSVVRDATSNVPFGDQQQFFMDLSTRLTPPDMLAIECRGQYVTVGSSRANKITYLADGKNRRERLADGGVVNSNVKLSSRSLTFLSTGRAEDNVNVTFESIEDGGRLRVSRRIYAKQLSEPIIIQTFYDKLSTNVDWTVYDGELIARDTPRDRSPRPARPDNRAEPGRISDLRTDFAAWLNATNRRDINGQMRFYMPEMKAYYLARNTPLRTVRVDKQRVFGNARSVDIRAGEPEIIFQNQGRVAIMRFVKEYSVVDRARTRRGAVIQELRWEQTADGWKIFSERDVRVIR
ncbi:MAG TPA: hypothetical protein VNA22_07540 [Pyrinomonadaceae bacterium]|nr:hypothetical protein [Pyrinomonadaceae bacterium]